MESLKNNKVGGGRIEGMNARSRVWVLVYQDSFLGEGRVALLREIERSGSINKAAAAMNMSYLKAWKLIDAMNKLSGRPLVVRTSGGKGGGGTVLTEHGLQMIQLYEDLNKRCEKFLADELEKLMNVSL
jgi:molybdate transport system regulatory protein